FFSRLAGFSRATALREAGPAATAGPTARTNRNTATAPRGPARASFPFPGRQGCCDGENGGAGSGFPCDCFIAWSSGLPDAVRRVPLTDRSAAVAGQDEAGPPGHRAAFGALVRRRLWSRPRILVDAAQLHLLLTDAAFGQELVQFQGARADPLGVFQHR